MFFVHLAISSLVFDLRVGLARLDLLICCSGYWGFVVLVPDWRVPGHTLAFVSTGFLLLEYLVGHVVLVVPRDDNWGVFWSASTGHVFR